MRELLLELPPLHPGQQTIRRSKARFRLVVCGRRWGKTRYGVSEALDVGCSGGVAWWVAPTYPMARIGWLPLISLGRQIPGAEIRLADRELWLPGGGVVGVRSADRPDSLRGWGLDRVVIDEAAYMKQEAWYESLRPALSDRQGDAIFLSTPNGKNWLFDLWEKSKDWPGWARFQSPTSSNPYIAQSEIDDARLIMGTREFSQEYLAEFVEAGGTRYRQEWLEQTYRIDRDSQGAATIVVEYEDGEIERIPLSRCDRFATVDPASSLKTEADYTVIASFAHFEGRLFVLDIRRARLEGPDILPEIRRSLLRWDLTFVGIETVAFQLTLFQAARRAGLPVEELKADRDKIARSLPLEGLAENGRLFFPDVDSLPEDDAAWVGVCHQEMLAFPNARYDDQVDALAYAALRVLRFASFDGPLAV